MRLDSRFSDGRWHVEVIDSTGAHVDKFEYDLAGSVFFDDCGRRVVIRGAIERFENWFGRLRDTNERAIVGWQIVRISRMRREEE